MLLAMNLAIVSVVVAFSLATRAGAQPSPGSATPAATASNHRTCIEQYPPSRGWGDADLKGIEAQCSQAGLPCDASHFISIEAARCIAQRAGLAGGRPALTYFYGDLQRPVWNVCDGGTDLRGRQSGRVITLDAVTGEVLRSSAYGAIP